MAWCPVKKSSGTTLPLSNPVVVILSSFGIVTAHPKNNEVRKAVFPQADFG
jgi:hypothetical protein